MRVCVDIVIEHFMRRVYWNYVDMCIDYTIRESHGETNKVMDTSPLQHRPFFFHIHFLMLHFLFSLNFLIITKLTYWRHVTRFISLFSILDFLCGLGILHDRGNLLSFRDCLQIYKYIMCLEIIVYFHCWTTHAYLITCFWVCKFLQL